MSKARDERDADLAARACAPRRVVNPSELRTSELVIMLNADMCAMALYGADHEHAPDAEREFADEVRSAMAAAAEEIDRRIPIQGGHDRPRREQAMSDYDDRCEAMEAAEMAADRQAEEIAERDERIATLEHALAASVQFRLALCRLLGVPNNASDALVLDRAIIIADELAKADRRTLEQERIITKQREKLETMRTALAEALDIAGRWIGGDDPVCDAPAKRDEARVADLRKLTEGP